MLIFQRFCTPDYKFPEHFEGIKILDICDPDWVDGASIVETCNFMDNCPCSSEELLSL